MTIEQAKKKLDDIAKGDYHSVRHEITVYSNGEEVNEYGVYTNNYLWLFGNSFEEVLDKLERKINETNNSSNDNQLSNKP